jgi:hypothetical protein
MIKKKTIHLLALFVMAMVIVFGQGCAAVREPYVGYDFYRHPRESLEGRQLFVILNDVDDIGDIWVFNEFTLGTDYFSPVLRAEWAVADASAQADLTRHLDEGVNYVVFTLFNKEYEGYSVEKSGGKFRCTVEFFMDGKRFYNRRLYQDFNKKALIFSTVLRVDLKNGLLKVMPMDAEEKTRIMDVVENGLAKLLRRTAGDARVDWQSTVVRAIKNDPEFKRVMEELKKHQKLLNQ